MRSKMSAAYLCATACILFLFFTVGAGLEVSVSDVKGYTRLSACKNSTLYRVEAKSDYETAPLLIHLVGSRYGEFEAVK